MIIDVRCDDGTTQIAQTILENEDSYKVQFLERNRKRLRGTITSTVVFTNTSFYHFKKI
jgi:hypothetical protein